ncbi:MAG: tetratricopeptide repeat protein, partial [Rothia dentocariosa]
MTELNKPLEQMSPQERLELGRSRYNEGKFDEAITLLQTIVPTEDSLTYTEAQLGLGFAYEFKGDINEAISAWLNIHREDNPKAYAWAQFRLGFAYEIQDRLDECISAWSNIDRKDNPEVYAKAQLNLGATYYAQGKLDQAIAAWSNIHREDDSEAYTRAQLGLGAAYYAQEDWEQAIAAWSNIHREDDSEAYAQAQLGLGEIHKDKGNIKQAKDAYRNVQGPLYYRAQREYRILGCPPELINDLRSLAKNTDKVRESLQIISDFESKVAHYSRASTAFSLFGDDKNPSNFRLSTIHGVNDPTEGLVLGQYWDQQGIPETIHTNNTATFISCFTFNHDSLNQFRLYGKENGQEATGVSLVFKKEFFSDQTDTLEFIADPSTDLSSKSEHIKLNETGKMENDNKKPLIGKSTLYRCIYLDPETGYWTLAQRDKSTFYREHNENEDTDAKEIWEDYYELISEIEEDVETHLFNEENNEEEDVETHLLNKENNDDNSVSNENN